MEKIEIIFKNVDVILKWLGILSAIAIALSVIALFFALIASSSWRRGEYASICLMLMLYSFVGMVSNFAFSTLVKAAKIYIAKNEPEDTEEE